MNPAVADRFLKNTLRVDIKSMLDVYGNDMSDSLIVMALNRNPVAWDGSDISNIIMYVDEEYSTTRTLVNSSGAIVNICFWRKIFSKTIYPDNQNDLPVKSFSYKRNSYS